MKVYYLDIIMLVFICLSLVAGYNIGVNTERRRGERALAQLAEEDHNTLMSKKPGYKLGWEACQEQF